jgi:YgiT-type zinc finger domain-containing protein
MRLAGRFIPRETVLKAAQTFELVEAYPGDKYLPSYLVLGRAGADALHVLVAVDVQAQNVRIITTYRPGPWRVGGRPENEEAQAMKCVKCGGELKRVITNLPFKVSDTAIVIIKDLPVVQCGTCPEYLIEDEVLCRVDKILARVEGGTELEIVRYAA